MRSQLWFDPQGVGGFSCLYSEAPAVGFLTPVSGHCQPGELADQGRWGRAGRGRWSPITTTVQPPSQDTGFPQQQSAIASLNGKTARYHEFINGWFSGAGRAHWVSWKASQIRLANGPAIPLGPWGTLETASGPLPQPLRRTFINLGGGCMGRYPGLQKKLPEENLYMEKMSVEGVIRSMSCFPCSLPWHHLHLRREQTTSCCVPVLLHCTYLTIHGDGLLHDTWNTVPEKNGKLQIGLKTPLSSILIPVPF